MSAFVVLKEKTEINLEEIKEFSKGLLANFKIPRQVFIIEEIPRNPSGKILRKELKQRFNNINP